MVDFLDGWSPGPVDTPATGPVGHVGLGDIRVAPAGGHSEAVGRAGPGQTEGGGHWGRLVVSGPGRARGRVPPPGRQRRLVVAGSAGPGGRDWGAGRLARRALRRRGPETPAEGLRMVTGPVPVSKPSKSPRCRGAPSPDRPVGVWSGRRIKSVRITRGRSDDRALRPRRTVGSLIPSPYRVFSTVRVPADVKECVPVVVYAGPGRPGTIGGRRRARPPGDGGQVSPGRGTAAGCATSTSECLSPGQVRLGPHTARGPRAAFCARPPYKKVKFGMTKLRLNIFSRNQIRSEAVGYVRGEDKRQKTKGKRQKTGSLVRAH